MYFKINKLHIKILFITGQAPAEDQCTIAKGIFNGIRSGAKVIHGKHKFNSSTKIISQNMNMKFNKDRNEN